ncbi:MAG: MFS transporter [Mucilaginibacter polytrichastri]|nr:MFS transporter [Mucilaginibacter polytrichastri]
MAGQTLSRLKSIFGGCIGNLVEWYDWYVYSSFALYFADSFFPKEQETVKLLNTAAIFAVGFLMRPVGGWLMGLYADRYGRKSALTLSVLLMSAGSLVIAVTPTYDRIHIAAPVILVLARLLQGLSVGGEYGTSATYLSEMADARHRGFYSSFQYVTLIMGQLTALSVLLVLQRMLSQEQLHEWGWRIPFGIGAVLAISALYLRRNIEETASYTLQSTDKSKQGSIRVLLAHPREVLTVIGMTLGGTVAFYTFSTYMQKFLVNTSGFDKIQASTISAVTLFVFMLLQPVFGWLSDRIGRKPLLIGFGVAGSCLTFPLLSAIGKSHDPELVSLLILSALLIVSGYTSINAIVKAELFPAHIRALGVGLPYALTVSVFGGSAEYLGLWFKNEGNESGYFWYVTGCILISLIVYICMADSRKRSRID